MIEFYSHSVIREYGNVTVVFDEPWTEKHYTDKDLFPVNHCVYKDIQICRMWHTLTGKPSKIYRAVIHSGGLFDNWTLWADNLATIKDMVTKVLNDRKVTW